VTHVGYLVLGYGATGIILAAYTARLLTRARRAARQANVEELRWRR
jgi:hypothetical protein